MAMMSVNRMNMIRSLFFTSACFVALTGLHLAAQDKTSSDSTSGIRTGDTLGGIKYFIKIVPVDTTLDEQMPMYKPDEEGLFSAEFVVVDKQPEPIKKVSPEYPEEARKRRIEGTVWVRCLVDKNGKVRKTHVIRADAELLIEPSVRAVMQWRFSPALLKGKPVAIWAAIPFRFKLNE